MLVVVPAAIALACVPSQSIGFDKAGYKYKAGDTVTVTGRGFSNSAPVVMKLQPPSGAESTVGTTGKATDNGGGFTDSFGLASDAGPGDYVLSATVGTRSARETFTVEPPAQSTPPINPFPSNPPPATPVAPVTPTEPPQSGNQGSNRAARAKAVRNCKKKFRSNRARTSGAKRSMAKKRAACVRKVRKRFP